MSTKDGKGEPIPGGVSGARNVLLGAPAEEDVADEACTRLLRERSIEGPLLFVTLSEAPDERLATWRAHGGEDPESIGFVTAGDTMRSAAAAAGAVVSPAPTPTVRTAPHQGDLTGIGIETSALLSELGAQDRPASVCFHSLTTLLEHVDPRDVFRFLHILTGRIEEAGARAHYHVDTAAHDEQLFGTLDPLFDATLAFEDGAWTARTR